MVDDAQVTQIESIAADGRGLRVEFVSLAERYAHRIVDVQRDECVLLRSTEAPQAYSGADWPVFQSLHAYQLPGSAGAAAALVGMSGSAHWSLSVEADRGSATPRLIFDAACRVKEAPAALISRYQADRPLVGARIVPLAIDGQSAIASVTSDLAQLTFDVTRAPTAADVAPTTLRWRYAVELI